jgi:hypothetical protein
MPENADKLVRCIWVVHVDGLVEDARPHDKAEGARSCQLSVCLNWVGGAIFPASGGVPCLFVEPLGGCYQFVEASASGVV